MRMRKCEGLTERLREAIQASGLTPHQIQTLAGIPKNTYYQHIGGGAMGELYIAKYCAVLHISADWLLGLRR